MKKNTKKWCDRTTLEQRRRFNEKKREYRKANPNQVKAHSAVAKNIDQTHRWCAGLIDEINPHNLLIKPLRCPYCHKPTELHELQAHHPTDYEQEFFLLVFFMCRTCHGEANALKRRAIEEENPLEGLRIFLQRRGYGSKYMNETHKNSKGNGRPAYNVDDALSVFDELEISV